MSSGPQRKPNVLWPQQLEKTHKHTHHHYHCSHDYPGFCSGDRTAMISAIALLGVTVNQIRLILPLLSLLSLWLISMLPLLPSLSPLLLWPLSTARLLLLLSSRYLDRYDLHNRPTLTLSITMFHHQRQPTSKTTVSEPYACGNYSVPLSARKALFLMLCIVKCPAFGFFVPWQLPHFVFSWFIAFLATMSLSSFSSSP